MVAVKMRIATKSEVKPQFSRAYSRLSKPLLPKLLTGPSTDAC